MWSKLDGSALDSNNNNDKKQNKQTKKTFTSEYVGMQQ